MVQFRCPGFIGKIIREKMREEGPVMDSRCCPRMFLMRTGDVSDAYRGHIQPALGCISKTSSLFPRSKQSLAPAPKKLWRCILRASSNVRLSSNFRAHKAQKSHEPPDLLNSSRALPSIIRVLRQIAAESSPESPAKSLSHNFLVVPLLEEGKRPPPPHFQF